MLQHRASRILALAMAPMFLVIALGWLVIIQPQTVLRSDPLTAAPEIANTLRAHLFRGEMCDPLPCWLELRIEHVIPVTDARQVSAVGMPFVTSDQLWVSGVCPAGASLVQGVAHDRWWNRFVPFTSNRWPNAVPFTLCIRN